MMIERRGSFFFFFLSKYFSTNDGKERLIVGAIVSIQLDRWNRLLITGTIVNKLWRIFDINIVNIIFIWCSSIGLRLAQRWNLPVKRRLRTWQQKVDEEKSTHQRQVAEAPLYRASKFDDNSPSWSRIRGNRWYRYIGRPNICPPFQPWYLLVSHPSNNLFSLKIMNSKIMKILFEQSG